MEAGGLAMVCLYPECEGSNKKPESRRLPAIDALRCVAFECLVVVAAAAALTAGQPLSSVNRERLLVAAERLAQRARL